RPPGPIAHSLSLHRGAYYGAAMNLSQRTLRILVPLLIIAPLHAAAQQPAPVQPVPVQPVPVQAPATQPAPSLVLAPRYAQPDDPWIYRGTDIPVDREWLF